MGLGPMLLHATEAATADQRTCNQFTQKLAGFSARPLMDHLRRFNLVRAESAFLLIVDCTRAEGRSGDVPCAFRPKVCIRRTQD
jgi:hypothetical protein